MPLSCHMPKDMCLSFPSDHDTFVADSPLTHVDRCSHDLLLLPLQAQEHVLGKTEVCLELGCWHDSNIIVNQWGYCYCLSASLTDSSADIM